MSKTILHPTSDRLLVEEIQEDEVTAGGVVLPDQAREKPQRGIIIAIGPHVNRDVGAETDYLAAGDEVVFSKYGGSEIKLNLKSYVLLRAADIFGKVEIVPDPPPPAKAKRGRKGS